MKSNDKQRDTKMRKLDILIPTLRFYGSTAICIEASWFVDSNV